MAGRICNLKKIGELYWEQTSISPVRNYDGVITHFIAIKEDITERKRMEEELMEPENLLQNSTVPTFVLDQQHNVIFWIRACEELTSMKAVDVIGTGNH